MIVRVAKWVAIGAAAALAACTAFAAKEDAAPGDATDGGASTPEATVAVDGASGLDAIPAPDGAPHVEAGADVVVVNDNLLANGDFEQSCPADWMNNTATLTPSLAAHGGQKSCSVCGGAAGSWSAFQVLPFDGVVGTRYRFEAYSRRPAAPAVAAATGISCRLEVFDANNGIQAAESPVVPPAGTGAWTKCSVDLVINAAAVDGGVTLQGVVIGRPSNTCLLVDDATLRKMP